MVTIKRPKSATKPVIKSKEVVSDSGSPEDSESESESESGSESRSQTGRQLSHTQSITSVARSAGGLNSTEESESQSSATSSDAEYETHPLLMVS